VTDDQPPVDGHFVDDELAAICEVVRAANCPVSVRLEVEERVERIRAELDPARVELLNDTVSSG
jgi:hypothetical protein